MLIKLINNINITITDENLSYSKKVNKYHLSMLARQYLSFPNYKCAFSILDLQTFRKKNLNPDDRFPISGSEKDDYFTHVKVLGTKHMIIRKIAKKKK